MYIDYKLLGKRLKKARNEANLTQADLAELIDKCPEYISKLENGISKPSLETLGAICHHLNTNISYIVTGITYSEDLYMNTEIFETIKHCTPAQLRLLSALAEDVIKYRGEPKK